MDPPEGRGFSPAEIAAPTLCWSRPPAVPQARDCAGHGTNREQRGGAAISAGLKPRPSGSPLRASKRGEKSELTGSTVTRCTSRWAAHIASTQHGQEVNPQKAVGWLMGQNVR